MSNKKGSRFESPLEQQRKATLKQTLATNLTVLRRLDQRLMLPCCLIPQAIQYFYCCSQYRRDFGNGLPCGFVSIWYEFSRLGKGRHGGNPKNTLALGKYRSFTWTLGRDHYLLWKGHWIPCTDYFCWIDLELKISPWILLKICCCRKIYQTHFCKQIYEVMCNLLRTVSTGWRAVPDVEELCIRWYSRSLDL